MSKSKTVSLRKKIERITIKAKKDCIKYDDCGPMDCAYEDIMEIEEEIKKLEKLEEPVPKKMVTVRVGSLYLTPKCFEDAANQTIGKPGLSQDIFANRRNVTAKLSDFGKEKMKKIKEVIKSRFGITVAFHFDKLCGCTMCPCSPGFKIVVKVDKKYRDSELDFIKYGNRDSAESRWITVWLESDEESCEINDPKEVALLRSLEENEL